MTESPDEREWAVRRDLAACYQMIAKMGWDDLISNHVSARLPGQEGAFLLNPFGSLFSEVTASNLVKLDQNGTVIGDQQARINPAGFVIHSAVYAGRPDVACVVHLHTRDGVAISCLREGLLPLNQTAMLVASDMAYHDYEGTAVAMDERERIQRDLGQASALILRNHGTLTVGGTVAEAFVRMYLLEEACAMQVKVLSMGREIVVPDPAVVTHMRNRAKRMLAEASRDLYWPALLRWIADSNADRAS